MYFLGWLVHSVSTNKPKPIGYLKKVKYIILDITNKKIKKLFIIMTM